ncbi:hypothetical protein ASPWEDRAFT_62241 [Aspergillus wentii DTO 134E9]|uniref:Zn(2)-C6 fungal-type domain-containing protein n=1 Tax=Aspergillus wentii DTO 134E9 TaxID=1073089 RepID=A0A1L9R7D8_ASPWE|nr:uncharacterized protein ASPWEDRAFT_62241 [Aspergillus wentii DTO 134E9]KAI9927453.1 hypothetical protein MW887_003066 [Aspergillus wentii]OJJ30830.1 hypothetical protein ASPWEDRAFT_62241 [Aspergillus wentii DTO 134E9]
MNSYVQKQPRKSHRKSRFGCEDCKRRRQKCDEKKPSCTNCVRRSTECVYVSRKPGLLSAEGNSSAESNVSPDVHLEKSFTFISSSQQNFEPPKRGNSKTQLPLVEQASSGKPCSTVGVKPFEFTAIDMGLYHHFMSSPDLSASQPHLQIQLCRLGFSFHYVLRLLLAFSGFHLARNPGTTTLQQMMDPGVDFYAEAERHYETAVCEVAAAVPCLGKENGHALYAAALFIFLCSIAKGPRPGEYLAFRTHGQAGCLSLFLGVRSVLETCTGLLSLDISTVHSGDSEDVPHSDTSHGQLNSQLGRVESEYAKQLEQLRGVVAASYQPGHPAYPSYSQALHRLEETYHSLYSDDLPVKDADLWPCIFSWLYTLPDIIMDDLQRRQPTALVVFSYFTVLLKRVDSAWFIRDWPQHIMRGIYQSLDGYYGQFVEWPLRQVELSA